MADGLSCPVAYGIFPGQELNPCPEHWQADSYPLDHRGSPPLTFIFLIKKFFVCIIYLLFFVSLGLCCCKQAFSSCGEWGRATLHCSAGASHCGGFS